MDKQKLIAIEEQIFNRKKQLRDSIVQGAYTPQSSSASIIFPPLNLAPNLSLKVGKWFHQGFFLQINDHVLIIDPGVGLFNRFNMTNLDPTQISLLYVSHNHTDHVVDTSPFTEVLLAGPLTRKWFFMPQAQSHEHLSTFHHQQLQNSPHVTYTQMTKSLEMELPFGKLQTISLAHSDPCFGFKLTLQDKTFAYISDTGFIKHPDYTKLAPRFQEFCSDIDTAVVNVHSLDHRRQAAFHLSAWDIINLFKSSKLTKLVLQHLSPIDINGEDSRYLYKLFLSDQPYEVILPHVWGMQISI